ncbi:hypothetical protein HDU85_006501 [Gaertneriomyces sp. JEL0708]|nr:hypothetical protein HDU85_006501 [Gaertneriomyces sp. JEL0708]
MNTDPRAPYAYSTSDDTFFQHPSHPPQPDDGGRDIPDHPGGQPQRSYYHDQAYHYQSLPNDQAYAPQQRWVGNHYHHPSPNQPIVYHNQYPGHHHHHQQHLQQQQQQNQEDAHSYGSSQSQNHSVDESMASSYPGPGSYPGGAGSYPGDAAGWWHYPAYHEDQIQTDWERREAMHMQQMSQDMRHAHEAHRERAESVQRMGPGMPYLHPSGESMDHHYHQPQAQQQQQQRPRSIQGAENVPLSSSLPNVESNATLSGPEGRRTQRQPQSQPPRHLFHPNMPSPPQTPHINNQALHSNAPTFSNPNRPTSTHSEPHQRSNLAPASPQPGDAAVAPTPSSASGPSSGQNADPRFYTAQPHHQHASPHPHPRIHTLMHSEPRSPPQPQHHHPHGHHTGVLSAPPEHAPQFPSDLAFSHPTSPRYPTPPPRPQSAPPTPAIPQPYYFPHDPATMMDSLERPTRLHKCPKPYCSKVYKNANGLKYHLEKGSCELDPSVPLAQPQSPYHDPYYEAQDPSYALGDIKIAIRPYFCKLCGKRYKNLNGLKYHAKAMHPADDFKRDVKGPLIAGAV